MSQAVATLVEAAWECPLVSCPVVAFDGWDRSCPACGSFGTSAQDWAETEDEKHQTQVFEDHATNLYIDEIQGRADNLVKSFDEKPKAEVITELTAISETAERLRPAREGDS